MSIETYKRIGNLFTSFRPNDVNNKKNLVFCEELNNSYLGINPNIEIINHNISIKDLKVFARIMSLQQSQLPDINFEDTESQRIVKILANEQSSQKYQLDFYLGNKLLNNSYSYLTIGSINLLDRGYQFSQYDIIDSMGNIDLGLGFGLAASMRNVGYGYIQELDTLNVIGSFVSEITIYSKDAVIINGTNTNETSTNPITWSDLTSTQWDNLTSTQWANL